MQWLIYDFGRTSGRYGQAVSAERITELRYGRGRETVALDVITAYLQALQAAFHFADRLQVLVQPAAIGGADTGRQVACLLDGVVQDALAVVGVALGGGAIDVGIGVAEEAFENVARIGQGRQRRRRRAPADGAGVGTTVAGVAQAHHARVLQAQLQ